ncbi:MAG TPA: hypothetical protein VK132_08795, partial [Gemmatimonadales bacterium]|nr:hypothetical protein [Gemmatimonadales bacterium]
RLGRPPGPRRLEGRLTASVPTESALEIAAGHADSTAVLTISKSGHILTSGTVAALETERLAAPWWGGARGVTLPMSEDCLACGARNPLGLQVALAFDDEGVWARLEPRRPWRLPDERLHPALVPVLLDEVAWWLGALVMKEGGLTNRLAISILEPELPGDGAVVAAGRFDRVAPVDRKRTFWRSELALGTSAGTILATASIIFRGGAEYSTSQIPYFRSRAPLDVFRRMFPNYL